MDQSTGLPFSLVYRSKRLITWTGCVNTPVSVLSIRSLDPDVQQMQHLDPMLV